MAIYSEMSLAEIAADLEETLSDLCINAGEHHLEPLLDRLAIDLPKGREASERLIGLMEELLLWDPNPLHPQAQDLMAKAVDEICRLAE